MPIHHSYPSRSLFGASASPVPALSVSPLVSFLLFFIIASRQYSEDQAPKAWLFSIFLSFFLSLSLLSFSLASSREHSRALFRLRQRVR